MKVPLKNEIRNATGTYGCPNCWPKNMKSVIPGEKICPACAVDLEWEPEHFEVREYWKRVRNIKDDNK